jgi:membrane protein DedA with SNARE-associated domain
MRLRLTILFILDTLVLVSLTYFLVNQLENDADLLSIIFLVAGVALSIGAFLLLYFKFIKLPLQNKKPKL